MLLGATIHEFGAVMPIVDIEEMMENLGICEFAGSSVK
tara:strand:- start:214 stop:327 length:114 start_codon:yes stop_codon:yes gene_type:complete